MELEPATTQAETLVRIMASALVDVQTKLEVSSERKTGGVMISIKTDPGDIGKVIGKQGRTARAMRLILSGHSRRVRHHFELNIVELEREAPPCPTL